MEMKEVTALNYSEYKKLADQFKDHMFMVYGEALGVRTLSDVLGGFYTVFLGPGSSYVILNEWLGGVYVDQIFVAEGERGCGVGKDIMKWVGEYTKSKGMSEVRLGVLAVNTGARNFYTVMTGFNTEAVILKKTL